MLSILYALASMFCAALNDMLFKLYARKSRSIGLYMTVIGVVWALVFAATVVIREGGALPDAFTVRWGIVSGLFSALANVLLIEAMSKHEVGICATIYRLNLAPAALLAFALLGETVSLWKILGIAAAVGAVLLFSSNSRTAAANIHRQGLWLVVVASLLRACMGIAYKWGLDHGAQHFALLSLNGGVWIVCGLGYHAVRSHRANTVTLRKVLTYGVGSGVLVCGIVLFMVLALRQGEASIVLPIAQLSFMVTALIGMFMLDEQLTRRKVGGMALALLCIAFMVWA